MARIIQTTTTTMTRSLPLMMMGVEMKTTQEEGVENVRHDEKRKSVDDVDDHDSAS